MLNAQAFLPRPIVLVACLIILEIFIFFLPEHICNWALKENGPIENVSVAGYFLGAIWVSYLGFKNKASNHYLSAVLLIGLALRELDFHTRFTTMGIFKTRFYISGEVPIQEKVIASIVIAILLISFIFYLIKNIQAFLGAMHRRRTWAISVCIAILLAVLSKTFDRCNEEINHFTTNYLGLSTEKIMQISEETFELAIPVFILLAIAHCMFDQSQRPTD